MIVTPDLDAWTNIPGWTCRRLREWYDDVAHDLVYAPTTQPRTVVEIGVAYGCSLAYLIARLIEHERDSGLVMGVRTVGVDVWEAHQGGGQLDPETWARVTGHGDPFRACLGELARSASYVFGRTTLVRDTGENAAKLFGPETVDVVFIDEHHTRESVGAAIRAWLPKVKRGGCLSGHDCNDHYPGVLQGCADELPKGEHGGLSAPLEIRMPHADDNGWGGVWVWRKP